MQKFLLISIVIATLVIPLRAARDPSARRGLRRAVTAMVIFTALYVVAVMFIYPRLS